MDRVSFLLVLVVATGFRLLVAADFRATALVHLDRAPATDMHFFHAWASRIAAGDWLMLGGARPDAPELPCRALRMRDPGADCAPASVDAVWERWLGPHAVWQDPLYAYFLAVCYRFAGADPGVVLFAQSALGVGSALLCRGIALCLFGSWAALFGGLAAAVYGPAILYENILLRETLGAFLALAACHLLLASACSPRNRLLAVGAGCVTGLGGLLRSTGFAGALLAIPAAAWLVASGKSLGEGTGAPPADNRQAWRGMLIGLCAGVALGLAPWMMRNLATGSPPLQVSATGAVNFVTGNSPRAGGSTGVQLGDDVVRILADSDGDQLLAVRLAIEGRGGLAGWLHLVGEKFLAFWQWRELPDNASYYEFVERSPALDVLGLRWSVLVPFAFCGFLLGARRTPGLVIPLVYVTLTIAVCSVFYNVSRFRLPAALLFMPLAGHAPFALWASLRDREWMRVGGGVAALIFGAVLVQVSATSTAPLVRTMDRLMTTTIAVSLAEEHLAAGRADAAWVPLRAELAVEPAAIRAISLFQKPGGPLRDASALATAYASLHESAARILEAQDRTEEAAEQKRFADALRFFLSSPRR